MSRGQARPDGHRPKGISPELRTVNAQEALAIIAAENAFAKNITTLNPGAEPAFDDSKNGWGFLTRQLQDPEYFRPARSVPTGANRALRYDPSQNKWLPHVPNPVKGQSKPGSTFTKKTAVSLLPADGRINLFRQNHGIVMLFDVSKCKVKQYIFGHNVRSDARWWYADVNGKTIEVQNQCSTTLEAIRNQNRVARSQNQVLNWNEVLPDLCAEAVIGIAVPQNDLTRRLNAQYRQLILLRELNIDVPILILTPDVAVHEYTVSMQKKDLAAPVSAIDREFVQAIRKLESTLLPSLAARYSSRLIAAAENKNWDFVFAVLLDDKPCQSHQLQQLLIVELLHKAIWQNDSNAVRRILQFDPPLNIEHDESMPIQLAAQLGHWACVEAIAKTVKTDAQDTAKYGEALLHAAWKNQTTIALILFEAGANAHYRFSGGEQEGFHTIHCAIYHNNVDLFKKILEKLGKTAANARDQNKITPLQLALQHNRHDFVRLLLEHGAVIQIQSVDEAICFVEATCRWDIVFTYCDTIFSDTQRCGSLVSRLLPIAINQKNIEAQRKLISIQNKILCGMERSQLEEGELKNRSCLVELEKQELDFIIELANEIYRILGLECAEYDALRRKFLDDHETLARNACRHEEIASTQLLHRVKRMGDAISAKNKCEQAEVASRNVIIANEARVACDTLSQIMLAKKKDLAHRLFTLNELKAFPEFCAIESVMRNEVNARTEVVKQWGAEWDKFESTFFNERVDIQRLEQTTREILQLQNDLEKQIEILKSEIQSKKPGPDTPALFAKIAASFNASDCEKKVQKKQALEFTKALLEQQLFLGLPISIQDHMTFYNARHWNDGKNNRTAPLIERAFALMKKPCSKLLASGAAPAALCS